MGLGRINSVVPPKFKEKSLRFTGTDPSFALRKTDRYRIPVTGDGR